MGFVLSGFADEISPDLEVQTSVLARLRVPGLDLRGVDGRNVLDLSDLDLKRVVDSCAKKGLHVQAIASPVNKVKLEPGALERESAKLRLAIGAAKVCGTRRIRIFSPETSDANAALDWMREHVKMAQEADVMLIHENDAKFWGAYPDDAKRLMEEIQSPHLRFAFDFANTVLLGYRPLKNWFPWIVPYLDTLHIKDAIQSAGSVVVAGRGEGQIKETLEFLLSQGWSGPLTLEPHLSAVGPFGGFSGESLFEEAVNGLREILGEVGIAC